MNPFNARYRDRDGHPVRLKSIGRKWAWLYCPKGERAAFRVLVTDLKRYRA